MHALSAAGRLEAALVARWPRLAGRVTYVEQPIATVPLRGADVVVSAHACGALTDEVLERASAVRARVAVLPCCQALGAADLGGLQGWIDGALAVDVVRAATLRSKGYRIATHHIAADVTPKNRLLMGEPLELDYGEGVGSATHG